MVCIALLIISFLYMMPILVRLWMIFRKPEHYIFCPAVLENLLPYLWKHRVGYYATIKDGNGKEYKVKTRCIFKRKIRSVGLLKDEYDYEYKNQTVTLAYNKETKVIVVCG